MLVGGESAQTSETFTTTTNRKTVVVGTRVNYFVVINTTEWALHLCLLDLSKLATGPTSPSVIEFDDLGTSRSGPSSGARATS